mmetsp:Transcript_30625/g.89476  ORF Transcript_30625/g.89476 Transcript_30625/m.89476 type:complete len:205 (-) Transcript_30625:218-832(-)
MADMARFTELVRTRTPMARLGSAPKMTSHCSSDRSGVSMWLTCGFSVAMVTPMFSGSSPAVCKHSLCIPPSLRFTCRSASLISLPSVSCPKYSLRNSTVPAAVAVLVDSSLSLSHLVASCVHTMFLPLASFTVLPVQANQVDPVRLYLKMRSGLSFRSPGLPRAHCEWTAFWSFSLRSSICSRNRRPRRGVIDAAGIDGTIFAY